MPEIEHTILGLPNQDSHFNLVSGKIDKSFAKKMTYLGSLQK